MNKLILATGALAITGLMLPNIVSAYRGDPSLQGPNYSEARHEQITQALESGDYNSYSQQMQGTGIARRVTADNFEKVRQMHELQLAGDTDGASQIRAELGLGQRDGSGAKSGQGSFYGRNR